MEGDKRKVGVRIFFLGSINQKNLGEEKYLGVISVLEGLGHEIIYDHILKINSKIINSMSPKKGFIFYNSVLKKMMDVDLIIAEISHESISVGFLISEAINRNKRVLALSNSFKTPNLLRAFEKSGVFSFLGYRDFKDLKENISFYLDEVKQKKRKRFNLFLSWDFDFYLKAASQKIGSNKSEYMRHLIKKDMELNKIQNLI